MQSEEDIKPVTYMKTHSAELIRSVSSRRCPTVITQNGEAKVVVIDVKSFERDRKVLLLLKLLSQGVTEAKQGKVVDQEALFDRLEKRFSRSGKIVPGSLDQGG